MKELLSLNCLFFVLLGLFGAFFHAEKKWETGEIDKLFSWFLQNPRMTVASLTSSLGLILAGVANGNLHSIQDPVQVVAAFMLGYALDSRINKT